MEEGYYGGNGTIHHTGYVDVEVDKKGKVVAVWFRCMMIPFKQANVDKERANEMERAYKESNLPNLSGIVFEKDK